MFSSSLDETPRMVEAHMEAARDAAKLHRKVEADLAVHQGRELYAATSPDSSGLRRQIRR
jgi:hypothetical protein